MRKFTVLATGALLIGAAAPAAADQIDWEAIAMCESGGDWSADTGNGVYGGLGISPAEWDDNGGVGLPSQASPQQQVAVAKRIMAGHGPGAWPACASRTAAGAAPVGSLTHYVTTLFAESTGSAAQAD
jgi:hypothetical protein